MSKRSQQRISQVEAAKAALYHGLPERAPEEPQVVQAEVFGNKGRYTTAFLTEHTLEIYRVRMNHLEPGPIVHETVALAHVISVRTNNEDETGHIFTASNTLIVPKVIALAVCQYLEDAAPAPAR